MAEIPEQGAPGPEAVPIPAAEEALLLGDRQEQRPEAGKAAPHLPGVLEEAVQGHRPEVPLREAQLQGELRLALQDAAREAEHLHLPEQTVIIMKQEDLPPGGGAADAEARDRIL